MQCRRNVQKSGGQGHYLNTLIGLNFWSNHQSIESEKIWGTLQLPPSLSVPASNGPEIASLGLSIMLHHVSCLAFLYPLDYASVPISVYKNKTLHGAHFCAASLSMAELMSNAEKCLAIFLIVEQFCTMLSIFELFWGVLNCSEQWSTIFLKP